MTSLIPVDTRLALRLREAGFPWHEVAKRCGSTFHLIRKALAKAGIPTDNKRYQSPKRSNARLLTPYQLVRMRRLKAAGATWKELGRITGIDPGRLKYYVKARQI